MKDALESDNSWTVVMAFAECVYSVSCAYTHSAKAMTTAQLLSDPRASFIEFYF